MLAPVVTRSLLTRSALVLLLGVGSAMYAEHHWRVTCVRTAVMSCAGPHCVVSRARLQHLLDYPSFISTSMRVLPVDCHGRGGVRLYAIRPTSFLAQLGIHSGDIVRSVNGIALSSPDRAITLYHSLRTARHVAVELDRGGESMVMHYTIL